MGLRGNTVVKFIAGPKNVFYSRYFHSILLRALNVESSVDLNAHTSHTSILRQHDICGSTVVHESYMLQRCSIRELFNLLLTILEALECC